MFKYILQIYILYILHLVYIFTNIVVVYIWLSIEVGDFWFCGFLRFKFIYFVLFIISVGFGAVVVTFNVCVTLYLHIFADLSSFFGKFSHLSGFACSSAFGSMALHLNF